MKPGRHAIVIFDPQTGEFYQRDVVVEVRRGEILLQNGKPQKKQDSGVENAELEEQADFIFKDWQRDNDEVLQQLLTADLNRPSFTSAEMRMSSALFFKVQELLP